MPPISINPYPAPSRVGVPLKPSAGHQTQPIRRFRLAVRWLRVTALILPWAVSATDAESTISADARHAYGANVGWIDARADVKHGARIGEFVCAGYLYGANVGWIHLGNGEPVNGMYYRNNSATDFGVNRDPLGKLTGYAWGANIGWLIFTNRTATGAPFEAPRVDPFSGRFSGFAYAPNLGWITLSNLFAHVKTDVVLSGADADADGIPDAWELLQVGRLDLMHATSNTDGDRATDREEYLADTDPLIPGDELRVIDFSPPGDGTPATITWTTFPTRIYRLEQQTHFDPTSSWLDAGTGWVVPDPGTVTTRTFVQTPAAQGYLRVEAARPLAPP